MNKAVKRVILLISVAILCVCSYRIFANLKEFSTMMKEGKGEMERRITINGNTINQDMANASISGSDIFNREYDEDKLVFCPSMKEAVEQAEPTIFNNYPGAEKVDLIIKEFESEDKGLLFYDGFSDKKDGCFVIARFQKRVTEEGAEYALIGISPTSFSKYSIYFEGKVDEMVKDCIRISATENLMGYSVAEEGEWFVWGTTRLEEVNHMTIDGQAPDEVISYEEFGKTQYFWYYSDLKSNSQIDDMKIECVK